MRIFGDGDYSRLAVRIKRLPGSPSTGTAPPPSAHPPPAAMLRLLLAPLLGLLLLAACTEPEIDVPEGPAALVAAPDSAALDPAIEPVPPDSATRSAFERIMAEAREQNLAARPMGEVVQAVAAGLLGTPYEAGLLDRSEQEELVASLTAFDCVLFNENVLALAHAIKAGGGYDTYAGRLARLRYRGGQMDGYCSRLHYFSDWLADNAARGHVRLLTEELGGVPLAKRINFMSTHREAYPRLASDEAFACIQEVEERLAGREVFYIPQARIREVYDRLAPGDIIATATNIEGLDVTHTGFVYKHDGRTGFIHASSSGEVKVSDDLARYIEGNRPQIGILVARPLEAGASEAGAGP